MIETNTLLLEAGNAWAMHYVEVDKGCGRQRFWYTDIGVKKEGAELWCRCGRLMPEIQRI